MDNSILPALVRPVGVSAVNHEQHRRTRMGFRTAGLADGSSAAQVVESTKRATSTNRMAMTFLIQQFGNTWP